MNPGKKNIWIGLFAMALFMAYGFMLIWLRDFAPGKEAWAAAYGEGKHFESRLAHVHGNLLALMNIVFGYLIVKLPLRGQIANWGSWLVLAGLLMPLGILAEIYWGMSPVVVFVGALSMVAGTLVLGVGVYRARLDG